MPVGKAVHGLPLLEKSQRLFLVAGKRPVLLRKGDIQPAILERCLEPDGNELMQLKKLAILRHRPGSAAERENVGGS